MKSTTPYLFLLSAFVISSVTAFAQPRTYTTTSKQAIKQYEEALKHYDSRQDSKAIDLLESAIEKDSGFVEAYIMLASIYEEGGQPAEAIKNYKQSFKARPDHFPYNYYRCAVLELQTCSYNDALAHFSKYLSYANVTKERKSEVEKYMNDCRFALEAMKNPVPFNPVNLGKGVNSHESEYYFSFTIDQRTMIFTRDIQDPAAMYGHQEDFFITSFSDSVWQPAINMGNPINTIDNEGSPSISADGKLVFYAACNRPDGHGGCDIYLSQRIAMNEWSKPINLGHPINTGSKESQPSFSSDGKTLYFTRGGRTSGLFDQSDIFYSVFQKDMTWSEPISLGDSINTDGHEDAPFIHADNQTLYFSSTGHSGMGGFDIFMSRRDENGNWGKSINLGYPINSCNNEVGFVVSSDGRQAYFSSDREGGNGKLDIYVFDLYEEARPLLTGYVKAKVVDAVTNLPLAAAFEIIDTESGKVIVSNSTDSRQGEFLASLPSGRNYLLNVNKDGYLFHSERFEYKEATDVQKAFDILVKLKKPEVGASVVLNNIFFDVDKYELKPESFIELNKLVDFMKKNHTLKIELSGHTDNTGDKKHNLELSQNRAKTVYDYLTGKGIIASRLIYKGYGDAKPIAGNDTEEGRSKNRRTEFTITAR